MMVVDGGRLVDQTCGYFLGVVERLQMPRDTRFEYNKSRR